jgi:formate hydrogenlyase subunit 3/multisubunit Na+/H+ antiporter MnhD subunit
MRALCGAIIAAGAMIGLGLSAVGFGLRYAQFQGASAHGTGPIQLHLWQIDTPLAFAVIFLTIAACAGLAIAFVGLAYHHHRRHHEMLHMQNLPVTGHQVMP